MLNDVIVVKISLDDVIIQEAYVKNGDYEKAIKIYTDRLKTIKSGSEAAWINHNWGRCLLEQGLFDQAESHGHQVRVNFFSFFFFENAEIWF